MGGHVVGEQNPGRWGACDFAFDLVRVIADTARPQLHGQPSPLGEERGAYNKGIVPFAESQAKGWETWEPARWRLGQRELEAKIFRFAHTWTGFSVDEPDRYIGIAAYKVVDTIVSLSEADGAAYGFDFSKPFGIEDLQAQVGSQPNVESVIRARTREPDHGAVIAANFSSGP